ncbi:alpha/beta hydrolase [Fulvivirgaceae bacterium BMA10]|uniref:Alpha/beta hydrolase n=1 Tax=Splendidivirga corallicola TaxID=3051826 RepID=A0ABT8KTP3_9BACT|nr:alpha/beta hydrolase [Fulvivirgaceae bacterium BMA10]
MNEFHINFNYKARYFKHGKINEQTEHIWFVAHGYGQLARFFIKKFEVLDPNRHCVIVPEGLSRFYLYGFTGRVGATWMTKEDRLTDIENYIQYLNSVYEQELSENINEKIKVTLLGFSQGVATISRWAMQEHLQYDRLILWAGVFPPDMNFEFGKSKLRNVPVHIVYGDQDQYIHESKIEEQKAAIEKLQIQPKTTIFSGEHDIDQETLIQLSEGSI